MEVDPYPEDYIIPMLKPNEAKEYYQLFGSNLHDLHNFLQHDVSLEGAIFIFGYFLKFL